MTRVYPLLVGLRYLRARQGNRFVSFIAAISMLGLVLGVSVLIVVMSVMNGFDLELRNRVLGVLPQGVIQGREPIGDWHKVLQRVAAHDEVSAAAPYVSGSALLAANSVIEGVTFTGVVPDYEKNVSSIGAYFTSGGWAGLYDTSFAILLGEPLAESLGLVIGDKVSLILPEAILTPGGALPRLKRVTLAGTFRVGADVDRNLVIMHMNDATRLLGWGDRIEGVRIRTEDLFAAPRILGELLSDLGFDRFTASSWMRLYGNLYEAIQMQKSTMFLLLVLIVAIAAFNLVSSLIMMVNDKRGDIAILRTMGADSWAILVIFIVYGSLISVVGIGAGMIFGLVIALNITSWFTWLDAQTSTSLMQQYFITNLPSEVATADLALIAVVALFISFLSTIYPAIKAAAANPAEALRYE